MIQFSLQVGYMEIAFIYCLYVFCICLVDNEGKNVSVLVSLLKLASVRISKWSGSKPIKVSTGIPWTVVVLYSAIPLARSYGVTVNSTIPLVRSFVRTVVVLYSAIPLVRSYRVTVNSLSTFVRSYVRLWYYILQFL